MTKKRNYELNCGSRSESYIGRTNKSFGVFSEKPLRKFQNIQNLFLICETFQ